MSSDLERDNSLLREQIRVSDVAFQFLFEQHKKLTEQHELLLAGVRAECKQFNFPDEDRPKLWDPLKKISAQNGECPKCGGKMEARSASGIGRRNEEMEADWDECGKCGYVV